MDPGQCLDQAFEDLSNEMDATLNALLAQIQDLESRVAALESGQ